MSTPAQFQRNLFLTTPMLRGADVLAVQQALGPKQGAGVAQDGVFGPGTAAAVRTFQTTASLRADGIVGRATWIALFGQAPPETGLPQAATDCFTKLTTLFGENLNPEQIWGIVANIKHESDFDATQIGDRGAAYGLAQWHSPRQQNFKNQYGKEIVGSSSDEQLNFIHHELTAGTYKSAGNKLAAAATAEAAGQIVSKYYEQPLAVDAEAAARGQTAQVYFNIWKPASAIPPSPIAASAAPAQNTFDVLAPRKLQALQSDHARYPGGQTWRLTTNGIVTTGLATDAAAPARIDALRQKYLNALTSVLTRTQVPIELVLAFLDVFAGQPATSYRLGADLKFPERTPDRIAAGIMQAPLHLARQALGKATLGPADLTDLEVAINAGTQIIWLQGSETAFDPPLVAAAYTAGDLFYDATNPWRLRQGVSGIIDRFIASFNAATAAIAATPPPPGISSLVALQGSLT